MKVEFLKVHSLNRVEYKKGDTINVSDYLFSYLTKEKIVKEVTVKKGK